MGLATALSELGVNVTYVAEELMSSDRKKLGWLEPETGNVTIEIVSEQQAVTELVASATSDSIHICQGIRANGLVGVAQKRLSARSMAQWVVMETISDVGWRGTIKRFEYSRLLRNSRKAISGVLAIGYRTSKWVVQRGVPEAKSFPFTYFLEKNEPLKAIARPVGPFRFIFVGQFIQRKRLDWLIMLLGELMGLDFELVVIGSGPLENVLRAQAEKVLGDRVMWIGRLPSDDVQAQMSIADCLILPSLFDGWGAVTSEALMCGTPVICSDTCGSAGVVGQSGVGGIFRVDDKSELKACLEAALKAGVVTSAQRNMIIAWSSGLESQAGALYLLKILECSNGKYEHPAAPWDVAK